MATYEKNCWQIYWLDYPHLIPVLEHRETIWGFHSAKWMFRIDKHTYSTSPGSWIGMEAEAYPSPHKKEAQQ